MSKFKSHKTVEQIAKKHRMDVSFIQKQLNMGEPIEHEHTQDHELAKDIALQHLDEIPDYYTRLKKMEADAKKHHKKFKDVKEHCGCEEDVVKELEIGLKKLNNISYQSIDNLMRQIMKKTDMTAKQLHNAFVDKHDKTPDEWIKNLKEETKSGDEGLRDWFLKSKARDPKTGRKVPGWTQIGGPFAGAPCARQPGQTSTPKCGSSKMAANLSPEEEDEAFRRKNREDPNQPQKKNAAKPTNVRTEEMDLQEKKKSGKKDACYHKVKSRYDVWPSAYASGALVKCRKVGAANWGTKSEETMHEEERYCPLCDKRETRSQCSYGEKAWDKVSVKDEEYSMARSELKTIEDAVKRLKAKVGQGEGDLEAWVQSKITKAADYIDTAADYVASGEMQESLKVRKGILKGKEYQIARSTGAGALSPEAATELGSKAVELRKKKLTQTELPKIKKEETLVDKLTNEILDEKCWTGYKRKKGTTKFASGSCVKVEDVTIEDADGNTFAEVVDLIQPEPIKGFKSQIEEATRLQAQTGNVIAVTLSWRAKYYSLKMFFPQVKLPTRKEINAELQKVYPGCNVIHHSVSEIQSGQPLIQAFGPQGGSAAKFGPNKNYVKPIGEEVEVDEAVKLDKSKMKCNKPKAQAVGDSLTGKSHVVKACSGGEEKIIRFGQRGVKGSPKKEGESEAYANRRGAFKERHAKNIARGPMSAAYWANKVKW
jgi:hypothetical protein